MPRSTSCTTDCHLRQRVADARFFARVTGNTKRVKCLLFSPMCSKPHLVPVPVRKVRGGFSTIADVFFRVHVNVHAPDSSTYYVSDNIVLNGIMPMSAGVEEPFSYTVFRSNHPFDRLHKLIRSFTGGKNLRVAGPLIVVKTDQRGAVCDVTPSELYYIERVVVHTLVDAGFGGTSFYRTAIDDFEFSYMSDPDIVV